MWDSEFIADSIRTQILMWRTITTFNSLCEIPETSAAIAVITSMIFQFSLWDSAKRLLLRMRRRRLLLSILFVRFLIGIFMKPSGKSWLSILFVRFKLIIRTTYQSHTFLSILFVRFCAVVPDDCRIHCGCLSILFVRFSGKEVYTLACLWCRDGFQFSLWDSWRELLLLALMKFVSLSILFVRFLGRECPASPPP